MFGCDFVRKRMLKVRVDEQQATLLKLNNAVSELSKELGDERDKPYIVSTKRLFPGQRELVTIGTLNNKVKFEVREKEAHHNEPHFHITIKGEGSGCYRISDFTAIKTNIPRSTEKKLLEWARNNRQILVDTWNEFNGYRVTVS